MALDVPIHEVELDAPPPTHCAEALFKEASTTTAPTKARFRWSCGRWTSPMCVHLADGSQASIVTGADDDPRNCLGRCPMDGCL
jgi:hypothetical protein